MKAQTGSNLIIWIGVLGVVALATVWFITNTRPFTAESETIQTDLLQIRDTLNIAEQSIFYERRYNPLTEEGTLIVKEEEICINKTALNCRILNLNSPLNKNNISLGNITFIQILKNNSGLFIEELK